MASSEGLRKRRKTESKAEVIGSDSGSSHNKDPVDWWDEFCRRVNGNLSPTKVLDSFKSVFRVSRKTFGYLCSLVKEDLISKPGKFMFKDGTVLSLCDQVAVSLRRLGSGESLGIIGDAFGLNHSSVAQITWRFVEAMEKRALHHLRWPDNDSNMDMIKSKFEKLSGLPNCCGAIDVTHILMNLRASDPTNELCCDHGKNHSIVLQAIVDSDMRFLDIVTGWPGKMNESLIFQNSSFYRLCREGKRLNGKLGEYIIGDSSYPLLPFLITPYEGGDLSEPRAEFNKRHQEVALVAQMALKRLKDNWGIIHGVMWRPDRHKLPRIIFVCCLLHNITLELEDVVLGELPMSNSNHDPGYRQQVCRVSDPEGVSLRDKLTLELSAGFRA
ncbi:hypothetical protein SAY87_016306 [Trapa incisa]|uniref:DDE Tnp4 domain-containing protein n=1 Tax=Trapa incisa TaxID=236973 RepID=A0AAN7QXY6_9MYRT|nr:hypothetical protein SAY87_016306 [Trapa incisa]